MEKGLLSELKLGNLSIIPKMIDRDIIIELSEKELKDILLGNADPRAKEYVTIEIHEGKLLIKIRLF